MTITLVRPVTGALTDRYGWRGAVYGAAGQLIVPAQLHTGQDFAAPAGAPIYAAHAGRITRRWWDVFPDGSPAGGNMLTIGSAAFSTRYAHLSGYAVREGDEVQAGQLIGYVGATGAATGAHLHFELQLPGGYVDPLPYLTSIPAPPERKRVPLMVFDLYFTGPTVETTGQNVRILLPYGSFHVPTDQLHDLLRRRRAAMLNATPGSFPDQMLDAEHEVISGFLQACNRAAALGIELDPEKFRAALSDALGEHVEFDTKLDPEQLAAAFDEAVPRIVASLMRQAGEKLTA